MVAPEGPWMLTSTGRVVEFARLTPDSICLQDISHHLAMTNRFNGATKFPYSVAQHSWMMHDEAVKANLPHTIRLDCLLHDAHEAYVGDMIAPLKWHLESTYGTEGYNQIKRDVDFIIRRKYILAAQTEICKNLDVRALVTERLQLMPPNSPEWGFEKKYTPFDRRIDYIPWRAAYMLYYDALRWELQSNNLYSGSLE